MTLNMIPTHKTLNNFRSQRNYLVIILIVFKNTRNWSKNTCANHFHVLTKKDNSIVTKAY